VCDAGEAEIEHSVRTERHALVERGILAYLVYRAKMPVPTTWLEAELAVDMALRSKRVFLRRAGAPDREVDAARP
jgi:hypothetical protein